MLIVALFDVVVIVCCCCWLLLSSLPSPRPPARCGDALRVGTASVAAVALAIATGFDDMVANRSFFVFWGSIVTLPMQNWIALAVLH